MTKVFHDLENLRSRRPRHGRGRRPRTQRSLTPGYLRQQEIAVDNPVAEQGRAVVFVLVDDRLVGAVALVDVVRRESFQAVMTLKQIGVGKGCCLLKLFCRRRKGRWMSGRPIANMPRNCGVLRTPQTANSQSKWFSLTFCCSLDRSERGAITWLCGKKIDLVLGEGLTNFGRGTD
jgi:hypothetical protein